METEPNAPVTRGNRNPRRIGFATSRCAPALFRISSLYWNQPPHGMVHCAPHPCIYEGAFVKPVTADFMRRFRARPRRHRLRSVESQARRSGNDFEPRFRRTSSEPEAEGGFPLPSGPVVFVRLVANQTEDTPKHLFGIIAWLNAQRRHHDKNYGERCPSP
jgi:hypothetical protein